MNQSSLPQEEVNKIWEQACNDLKNQLSPATFNTWILANPLVEIYYDENQNACGTINTPTAFHAKNLKKNLYTQLQQAISLAFKKNINLKFEIKNPGRKKTIKTSNITKKNQNKPTLKNKQQINAANEKKTFKPLKEGLFSQSSIKASLVDRAITAAKRIGLKFDYTFDTFAVSTSNEMAHAAAIAVSKKPGQAYNPLFLYGGVGVGKTHLMHAIGHNILKVNPTTKIIYSTGEEFTNDIINAIQTKKAIKFKQKYRNAQVLLIDDIQFIAGKNAVQEEFFHTFNALTKLSSQIVLTSDRPPHEINLLEDRLKSRFEAGLMIDIQQPSLELRTAIVLIKTQANNLDIPIELATMIAKKVDSARKIEGTITKIRSQHELNNKAIDENLISSILEKNNYQTTQVVKIKPGDLIKKVASFYNLKPIQLKGKKRNKEIVKARHVCMYLLKKELKMSYVEIGKWFSNRDHTSVMHAYNKIDEEKQENNRLSGEISKLKLKMY